MFPFFSRKPKSIAPLLLGDFQDDERRQIEMGYGLAHRADELAFTAGKFGDTLLPSIIHVRAQAASAVDAYAEDVFHGKDARLCFAFLATASPTARARPIFTLSSTPASLVEFSAGMIELIYESAFDVVTLLQPILQRPPFSLSMDFDRAAQIAQLVGDGTQMLIYFHEVGHCSRSHFGIWQRVLGVTEIDEGLSAQGGDTVVGRVKNRMRKALEIDADLFAANLMWHYLRDAFENSENVTNDSQLPVYLFSWLVALAAGSTLGSFNSEDSDQYLPPFVRSIVIDSRLSRAMPANTRGLAQHPPGAFSALARQLWVAANETTGNFASPKYFVDQAIYRQPRRDAQRLISRGLIR
jgi:hypothetical protein